MARSKQAKNWSYNPCNGVGTTSRHEGTGWWMQDPAPNERAQKRRGSACSATLKTGPLGKRYQAFSSLEMRCCCGRCWDGPTTHKNPHASQLARTRESHRLRQELARSDF